MEPATCQSIELDNFIFFCGHCVRCGILVGFCHDATQQYNEHQHDERHHQRKKRGLCD